MMDSNGSGNISDESDSFDKLDLSEIVESNEMDMKSMVKKIKNLEADILAIKTKQRQNENADQMLQMICQTKEMKKEMVVMNSELNGEFVGFEDEVGKLVEENGKLKVENTEKCLMEEMKKEMDGMNKEMNKLNEGIGKILKKMETINNENLMEKFEMKEKFEQIMKMMIDEKDREYEQLQEKYDKLKEELVENECAPKKMEKNKTEIEDKLLHQLDPESKQRIRMVFESLRLASGESIELIDPIIEFGFINPLVKALNIQDEKIRLNAAWALTNIAAGNSAHTRAIVEANGIEPLLKMCTSVDNLLAEQALWAISNIAADNIKYRDELIARGVVPFLLEKAKRMDYLKCSFVRTIAWSIESLCCHEPLPSNDLLVQLVPTIAVLLKYNDFQCKIDTCWTIVHLTSGPKENIPLAIDFIPDIVSFINSGKEKLILPALHVLENFAKAEPNIFDDARKQIKKCLCFFILLSLKHHKSKEIGKIADSILNKFFPKPGKMEVK